MIVDTACVANTSFHISRISWTLLTLVTGFITLLVTVLIVKPGKCFGIVEGFKAYKVDALSWLDIIINKLSDSFIN